ncbi:MAG: hypothetical protein WC713_04850 [Candidatus Methylomirabilota bacterium]
MINVSVLVGLMLLGCSSSAWAGAALLRIPAVVHSHSSWSTGDQSLEQLVGLAGRRGVEAVFLAENFFQRFEYGLPPLRGLLRYRVEFPSILEKGPQEFLDAVSAVNARQKRVLLIPGVEVIPHSYWTGSLLNGTLTMHDGQKNILALGLSRPADYREIPATGNPHHERWGWWSLLLVSPVLLLVVGGWLFTQKRRRVVRLERFQLVETRRPIGLALTVTGIGLALLANNFPFRVSPISHYDAHVGLRPFQAMIDHIDSRGGLAVWSLPEARDNQTVRVAWFTAAIKTVPAPDDLLRTHGFAAFGGVYEDTTTFTRPGGEWDHLLLDFLVGRRKSPAWAIGEAAYHHEGQAGKRFGEVQTVILSERKDSTGLIQAFKAGRMYAMRRSGESGLALERFQVVVSGLPPALAGGQLALPAEARPEVQVAVTGSGPVPMQVAARLIRNGCVVHAVTGHTPLTIAWTDKDVKPGARAYYRLEVNGAGGHQILSNPIFVTANK